MAQTGEFLANQGVAFDPSAYIKTSRTLAISTTAFEAGALFVTVVMQDSAGAINAAIIESGIVWKAVKKNIFPSNRAAKATLWS